MLCEGGLVVCFVFLENICGKLPICFLAVPQHFSCFRVFLGLLNPLAQRCTATLEVAPCYGPALGSYMRRWVSCLQDHFRILPHWHVEVVHPHRQILRCFFGHSIAELCCGVLSTTRFKGENFKRNQDVLYFRPLVSMQD